MAREEGSMEVRLARAAEQSRKVSREEDEEIRSGRGETRWGSPGGNSMPMKISPNCLKPTTYQHYIVSILLFDRINRILKMFRSCHDSLKILLSSYFVFIKQKMCNDQDENG